MLKAVKKESLSGRKKVGDSVVLKEFDKVDEMVERRVENVVLMMADYSA